MDSLWLTSTHSQTDFTHSVCEFRTRYASVCRPNGDMHDHESQVPSESLIAFSPRLLIEIVYSERSILAFLSSRLSTNPFFSPLASTLALVAWIYPAIYVDIFASCLPQEDIRMAGYSLRLEMGILLFTIQELEQIQTCQFHQWYVCTVERLSDFKCQKCLRSFRAATKKIRTMQSEAVSKTSTFCDDA